MNKNRRSLIALLAYYAVIVVLMVVVAPGFFTASNFNSIFRSTATTLVASLGMMLILLVGDIDVSVGSILAMCCVVCGKLALMEVPLGAIVIVSMCVGAFMGLLNSLVVIFLHIDAIVATLGMLNIYRGVRIVWTGGVWLTGFPEKFLALGQGSLLNISYTIYIAAAVTIIMFFVTRHTTFGRNFYAVGSNARAAHLSGINVRWTRISAFVICGMLVGLTAVMYTSRFGSVQYNTGNGWEMTVISAAVVGGTSTVGGEGDVVSVALGAILISALTTLLVFLGVDSLWEEAVQGIIILLSVCTYSVKMSSGKKPRLNGGTA